MSSQTRVLDVTLRDGGYVNGWSFPAASALAIVSTLARAGIPFIEVGYYRPRLADDAAAPGPKCCRDAHLDALTRVCGASELVVMVHPRDVGLEDYVRLRDHGVSRVRFVVSTAGVPDLDDHIAASHRAGLRCSVNLIRASQRPLESLVVCGREAEAMGAEWLYTADSNGSLFPDRVEQMFHALASVVRIPLGFHAHNPLQLAFANSLAAVRGGATLLDSSLGGMGKGAGNLVTELIAAYVNAEQDTRFPIAQLVAVTSETLSAWIGRDHEHRCESALCALLDLNADDIKDVAAASERAGRTLLSELVWRLEQEAPIGGGTAPDVAWSIRRGAHAVATGSV